MIYSYQANTLTWWWSLVRVQLRLPNIRYKSAAYVKTSSGFFMGGGKVGDQWGNFFAKLS